MRIFSRNTRNCVAIQETMAVGINVVVGFVAGSVEARFRGGARDRVLWRACGRPKLYRWGCLVWHCDWVFWYGSDSSGVSRYWLKECVRHYGWLMGSQWLFFFLGEAWLRRIGIPMNYGFGMIGFDMGF